MPDNTVNNDLRDLWNRLPDVVNKATTRAQEIIAADPSDKNGEAAGEANYAADLARRLKDATARAIKSGHMMAGAPAEPMGGAEALPQAPLMPPMPPPEAPGLPSVAAPMAVPPPVEGLMPPIGPLAPPVAPPVAPPQPPVTININNGQGQAGPVGEVGQEGPPGAPEVGQPLPDNFPPTAHQEALARSSGMGPSSGGPEPIPQERHGASEDLGPIDKVQQSQDALIAGGKILKQKLYDSLGIGRDLDLGVLSSAAHKAAVKLESIPFSDTRALMGFAMEHFGPSFGARAKYKSPVGLEWLDALRDSMSSEAKKKQGMGQFDPSDWKNPEVGKAVQDLNMLLYFADREAGVKVPPPVVREADLNQGRNPVIDWWNDITPPVQGPALVPPIAPPVTPATRQTPEQLKQTVESMRPSAADTKERITGVKQATDVLDPFSKVLDEAEKDTKEQLGLKKGELPTKPTDAQKTVEETKKAGVAPTGQYIADKFNNDPLAFMEYLHAHLPQVSAEEINRRMITLYGEKPQPTIWNVIAAFFAGLSKNPEAMKIANQWHDDAVRWDGYKEALAKEYLSAQDRYEQNAINLKGHMLSVQAQQMHNAAVLEETKRAHDIQQTESKARLEETKAFHAAELAQRLQSMTIAQQDKEVMRAIQQGMLDERKITNDIQKGTISHAAGTMLLDAMKRVGYDPYKNAGQR